MRVIVSGKWYPTYKEARDALGGSDVPENLPMDTIGKWELFRDGGGKPTLIAYTWLGTVLEYYHAYYDDVQGIWRWQV